MCDQNKISFVCHEFTKCRLWLTGFIMHVIIKEFWTQSFCDARPAGLKQWTNINQRVFLMLIGTMNMLTL